jgi:hypothetical protein
MDLDAFPSEAAPSTDGHVVQLTDDPGLSYPLYFYIPSISGTSDLVYHRAHDGEVQLYRRDLESGTSEQLTDATASDTHWRPWCTDPGRGVLDHRSVLDRHRNAVLYFDGNTVRRVDLETGADHQLFDLPADRVAIGQNCVTADGEWFVYVHHDRQGFEDLFDDAGNQHRHRSEGTALAAYNLEDGTHQTVLRIDSPIHHVSPWKGDRLLFCHPATENGLLYTDVDGGWYAHCRTQDQDGGAICHYHGTDAGVTYEVNGREGDKPDRSGIYDPTSHGRVEFDLPDHFGYTHTAFDPAGEWFVYESQTDAGSELWALQEYDVDGDHTWECLVGDWPTNGGGQKAHFHPRLTPDREWLVFVAAERGTDRNQIYALDVRGYDRDSGVPEPSGNGGVSPTIE